MTGNPGALSDSAPGVDAGGSLAIAGTVAFIVILVSSAIGWGLWMSYRTAKALSSSTKSSIDQHVRSHTFISEMSAVELGHSFTKSRSCNGWGSTQFPSFRPHDSDLSTYLPTLPERAYVPDYVPYPAPFLPCCQTSDTIRSPTLIAHSATDLHALHDATSHQTSQTEAALLSPPMLIDFDNDDSEDAIDLPMPCIGLGLDLSGLDLTEKGMTTILPLEVRPHQGVANVTETPSEHKSVDVSPQSPELPSCLIAPMLPTPNSTSAPVRRSPAPEPNKRSVASQLASPPMTPTLVLTAPSIHCGLDSLVEGKEGKDHDDELESWSDILVLQEYEDGENIILDSTFSRLLDDFPSPPETPTKFPSPTAPQLSSVLHGENSPCVDSKSAVIYQVACDEGITQGAEDNIEEPEFDYAAFRRRLSDYVRDVNEQENIILSSAMESAGENSVAAACEVLPSPSISTQVDLERPLARNGSAVLPQDDLPASTQQGMSLRSGPRILTLPKDLQPLLDRMERSKLRSHT